MKRIAAWWLNAATSRRGSPSVTKGCQPARCVNGSTTCRRAQCVTDFITLLVEWQPTRYLQVVLTSSHS